MVSTIKTKYETTVLLIDNGSSDGTWEFLNKFIEYPGRAAICYPENRGVAYAWNRAIQFAIGTGEIKYVLIIGNDTLLQKNCIDRLVQTADRTGEAIVTATNYASQCEKPFDILNYKIKTPNKNTEDPDFSCFLLRIASVIELTKKEKGSEKYPGLFDETIYPAYFEDNDYHYRLKLAGLRAIRTSSAPFYHFLSATKKENSEIDDQINQTFKINEQYFIEKWGGLPGKETRTKPNV
jgi:GT2 family glycosyltransferase